jgi:hypothetical protein
MKEPEMVKNLKAAIPTKGKANKAQTQGLGVSSTSQDPGDEWATRDDMHTLHKAHQIRSDPTRHGRVKAMAKTLMTAIRSAKPVKQPDAPDSELPN